MTMLTKQLAGVAAGVFGSSGLEIGGLPTAGLAICLLALVTTAVATTTPVRAVER
jgi:hypothetical protein